MADFSWLYMAKKHGAGACEAAIVESVKESNNSYRARSIFLLPYGSDKLVFRMSRFAHCSLCEPEPIGIDFIPDALFCLQGLLLASFPKNTATGVFRAHDGALGAGDMDDPDALNRGPDVAFAGIGIMIMNACRQTFSPLAPDNEVVKLSDQKFLCVFDKRILKTK
jgi:hypothetical protein